MKHLAVFASGAGTNTKRFIDYFKNSEVSISLIVCNNPQAGVLDIAKKAGVPVLVVNKEQFYNSDTVLKKLSTIKTDLIVLAGFLWKIPGPILLAYRDKIVNVHPALLPKYGGKGMYGARVHQEVLNAREKESGITIHYVNENYDEGKIILQKQCEVTASDTPESLARKVHTLEYEYYPKLVEELVGANT